MTSSPDPEGATDEEWQVFDTCLNCGKPVVREWGIWRHADQFRSRSCSFIHAIAEPGAAS